MSGLIYLVIQYDLDNEEDTTILGAYHREEKALHEAILQYLPLLMRLDDMPDNKENLSLNYLIKLYETLKDEPLSKDVNMLQKIHNDINSLVDLAHSDNINQLKTFTVIPCPLIL